MAVQREGIAVSDSPVGDEYIGRETVPLYLLTKNFKGIEPPTVPALVWRQSMRIGEGKPRELDLARSAAVWAEATDPQLSADRKELEAVLMARLPDLIDRFRAAMEGGGLSWFPKEFAAAAGLSEKA